MSGVTITAGDTWLGSSASIQCQTGYQPVDSEVSDVTITCLETGDWSQIATTFNCLIGMHLDQYYLAG